MCGKVSPHFIFSICREKKRTNLEKSRLTDCAGPERDKNTVCKVAVILIPVIQMNNGKENL